MGIHSRNFYHQTSRLSMLFKPSLTAGFQTEARVADPTTGEVTLPVRFGAASLSAPYASAKHLLRLVRQHWSTESALHHRRDVTMGENRIHARTGYAAHLHAVLNNSIVVLLHHRLTDNMARGVCQIACQMRGC